MYNEVKNMAHKIFTDFFPYGAQYHRAPTPLRSEWDGDMEEIKKQGYTHIQFRPQWRWHERIRGEFVWDDLDSLFNLAEKHSLRVILKPMLETAPDWVFTELDGKRIGFHGTPLEPIANGAFYVGGWWPCFDNPDVVNAACDFIKALVTRYKKHPALWIYNAWNEPRSRPLGQCTCRHSVNSYRKWLKKRFKTIEALNDFYGKAWTSFETVEVPHHPGDYVEMFLWRLWAADSVASQVEFATNAIKEADPDATVMCHVGASTMFQDPACDTSNDLLNSKKVDFYGTSLGVPMNPETPYQFNEAFFLSSWLKRVDSNWWCQEFYTNTGPWWREAKPAFVEEAALMVIGAGCHGFTFWQYRSERLGEESNGFGMRNIDGSPTPRSIRCDKIAAFLKNEGADFAKTFAPDSDVAIFFDPENQLLMRIQHMQCTLAGIENIGEEYEYSYKKMVRGAHSLFRRLGHRADFALPGDDLSKYRAVLVSCLEMTNPNIAKTLTDYVENGGCLLIEYPFACRDTNTWVSPTRPNLGLDALTGCREVHRVDFSCDMGNKIFFDSQEEICDGWHVTLEPTTENASVIGRWEDSSPAVIEHQFGKGRVITSGGSFSIAVHDNQSSPVPHLFKKLLDYAGIAYEESDIWTALRRSDKHEYRFFYNVGKDEKEVMLDAYPVYASSECTIETALAKITPYGVIITKKEL